MYAVGRSDALVNGLNTIAYFDTTISTDGTTPQALDGFYQYNHLDGSVIRHVYI